MMSEKQPQQPVCDKCGIEIRYHGPLCSDVSPPSLQEVMTLADALRQGTGGITTRAWKVASEVIDYGTLGVVKYRVDGIPYKLSENEAKSICFMRNINDAVIELVEAAEDVNGACDGLPAFNKKLDRLSVTLSALNARIKEVT